MDSIPEIVVFSVYRVSRVLDPSSSTKQNISHPIFCKYNSFPATGTLGTYMTAIIQEKKLSLWTEQLLYAKLPDVVYFECGFLVNVSHLAIGRAAEVIPCDMNLVTENKEESTESPQHKLCTQFCVLSFG